MTTPGQRAADLLGARMRTEARLSGGDLSTVARVAFDSGLTAIVKETRNAPIEADMLRALASAGAPVPEVLDVDIDLIVMSEAPAGGPIPWRTLGEVLHLLHAVEGGRYGWKCDYAFGACRIANGPADSWVTFWADNRLRPFIGGLREGLGRRLERLADDLGNRLPDNPGPSLLHGDLWTGNVLSAGRHVTLIDPACYYGHGEVDIAMLHLFGRPETAFYEAYPLATGWRERLPIYSLWPALVHLKLFGGGYLGMVEGFLDACGV